MADSGGSLEASMVFEKLFTDYLKSQENESMRKLLLRKLERMRIEQPILKGIQIGDDGHVFINMREGSESKIVSILSNTFDSLYDVAAFSIGQETAFRNAEGIVFAVMKQFNEPFLRLGIKDIILKGSMSEQLSSGVEGFDNILGGGLPRSDMILLTGPPGAAKYQFAFQFLAEGLRNGGSGIAVLSTMNVKEMRERLTRLSLNIPSCEAKGRFKTVDWYSHKSRPIVGMEELGHVLVPSKDIANLDIAFTRALEGLSFAPTTRATVDMITSALNIYELADVIEFVQRQKSRFKDKGIASIFIVEEGAHDERIMTTLKHMADGVISITSDDKGNQFIEIESMRITKFKTGTIPIQLSSKGMSVIGHVLDEANVISIFCNIPLVTKDIAQRLVDAGFIDLEKLSQASQSELGEVNLVTKEVAKSIVDYTRTVEYSHSVLSSRSEKWLMKAKEQVAAGDLKKAQKSLERALEIDPTNAFAWVELTEIKKKLNEDK